MTAVAMRLKIRCPSVPLQLYRLYAANEIEPNSLARLLNALFVRRRGGRRVVVLAEKRAERVDLTVR
jgi:hypothetical protein